MTPEERSAKLIAELDAVTPTRSNWDQYRKRFDRDGQVSVRNPERFDYLCDSLDCDGIAYTTKRGRGGWIVERKN